MMMRVNLFGVYKIQSREFHNSLEYGMTSFIHSILSPYTKSYISSVRFFSEVLSPSSVKEATPDFEDFSFMKDTAEGKITISGNVPSSLQYSTIAVMLSDGNVVSFRTFDSPVSGDYSWSLFFNYE